MREFRTAAKAAALPTDRYEFTYDGRKCVALRPSEGKVALLIASEANPLADEQERIAATINFALTVFDNDTRRYFGNRLINPEHPDNWQDDPDWQPDPDDPDEPAPRIYAPFEFEDLMNVVYAVIGEFADRPTKPSSGSTSLPAGGGTTSTGGASRKASGSSSRKSLTPVT